MDWTLAIIVSTPAIIGSTFCNLFHVIRYTLSEKLRMKIEDGYLCILLLFIVSPILARMCSKQTVKYFFAQRKCWSTIIAEYFHVLCHEALCYCCDTSHDH